jgi:hypothetical protein
MDCGLGGDLCGKQKKLRNRGNSSCNSICPVLHRTGLRRELSAARQPSDGLQPSKGRVTRRNGQALGAKQRTMETLPLGRKISAIPASVKAKSPRLRVTEWRSMAVRDNPRRPVHAVQIEGGGSGRPRGQPKIDARPAAGRAETSRSNCRVFPVLRFTACASGIDSSERTEPPRTGRHGEKFEIFEPISRVFLCLKTDLN